MNEPVVRMVLLPRYTAVYGEGPLDTAPFSVRRYARVILTGWAGRGLGATSPAATITLDQSADLGHWHEVGSVSPAAGTEASETLDLLDLEWARLRVEVEPDEGEEPGTTVWAVGAFVPREGA